MFFNRRTWTSGIVAMCLAMLFWAMVEIVPRFFATTYSPFQIVWTRYAAHLGFMLVVFAPRYRMSLARTKRVGWQIVRGLMMLGMPVAFIFAANRMPADDVMAIFWISPFMVLALGMWFLREKPSVQYWLIALVALVGVWLMLYPSTQVLHWSIVLPIGMALCFGVYQFLTRMLREESTLTSLFYTAVCVLVPMSLDLPLYWRLSSLHDTLLMITIGLLGFAGLYFLDRAYEIAPGFVVAPFAFTQPIWTMLLHWVLGIAPGGRELVGAILIIGSGVVLWQKDQVVNYEY